MQELHSLETSVLVDMLAAHTHNYTKMMSEGIHEESEFNKCKLTIQAIQAEITFRQTPQNTSISDPNILLPEIKAIEKHSSNL
jgi:hypothetical protein